MFLIIFSISEESAVFTLEMIEVYKFSLSISISETADFTKTSQDTGMLGCSDGIFAPRKITGIDWMFCTELIFKIKIPNIKIISQKFAIVQYFYYHLNIKGEVL